MSFYGFDWQNTPQFSRLFSPDVVNRGQQAFTQGMSQFTPYDPEQLQKIKDQQAARLAQANAKPAPTNVNTGFLVGQDGRVYDSSSSDFISNYFANNRNNGEIMNQMSLNPVAYDENKQKGNDELLRFLYGYGFKPLAGK